MIHTPAQPCAASPMILLTCMPLVVLRFYTLSSHTVALCAFMYTNNPNLTVAMRWICFGFRFARRQADAAVFAEILNGLSLPDRGVMKALFLSGAEIIPRGVGVGVGEGAADGDDEGGEGSKVREKQLAPQHRREVSANRFTVQQCSYICCSFFVFILAALQIQHSRFPFLVCSMLTP